MESSKQIVQNQMPVLMNVNDIVLQPKPGENIRPNYVVKGGRRVAVPELTNFLSPIPRLELQLPVPEKMAADMVSDFDDLRNHKMTFDSYI